MHDIVYLIHFNYVLGNNIIRWGSILLLCVYLFSYEFVLIYPIDKLHTFFSGYYYIGDQHLPKRH